MSNSRIKGVSLKTLIIITNTKINSNEKLFFTSIIITQLRMTPDGKIKVSGFREKSIPLKVSLSLQWTAGKPNQLWPSQAQNSMISHLHDTSLNSIEIEGSHVKYTIKAKFTIF